ncbi:hypothetical protein C7S18_15595 [Ahniella affigens]|uniref:Uncharacterized protein n=1 Tax=Ahniella affigens TaxID=2021234 RepID=A0A2P1PUL0_9GAMM|nr:hypothetical protein C7S18_15595 [Ahniella affigens]
MPVSATGSRKSPRDPADQSLCDFARALSGTGHAGLNPTTLNGKTGAEPAISGAVAVAVCDGMGFALT